MTKLQMLCVRVCVGYKWTGGITKQKNECKQFDWQETSAELQTFGMSKYLSCLLRRKKNRIETESLHSAKGHFQWFCFYVFTVIFPAPIISSLEMTTYRSTVLTLPVRSENSLISLDRKSSRSLSPCLAAAKISSYIFEMKSDRFSQLVFLAILINKTFEFEIFKPLAVHIRCLVRRAIFPWLPLNSGTPYRGSLA